jgi:hypothetical protein
MSRRYTREEELSLTTGIPMRVTILDSQLIMSNLELITTLENIGFEPNVKRFIRWRLLPTSRIDQGVAEELLNAIPMNIWEDYQNGENVKRDLDLDLYHAIIKLPSSVKLFPKLETRRIYLRHLFNMSKGTNWSNFTCDEVLDVIKELRNWTLNTLGNLTQKDTIPILTSTIKENHLPYKYFPMELYKKAGYVFKEVI